MKRKTLLLNLEDTKVKVGKIIHAVLALYSNCLIMSTQRMAVYQLKCTVKNKNFCKQMAETNKSHVVFKDYSTGKTILLMSQLKQNKLAVQEQKLHSNTGKNSTKDKWKERNQVSDKFSKWIRKKNCGMLKMMNQDFRQLNNYKYNLEKY